MTRWFDRAARLTYEGESITESVDLGTSDVVVTTHRLLVFSPEGDDEDFTQIDLPNVRDVEAVQAGERRFLVFGAKAGAVGAITLAAGALLPMDSLVGDASLAEGVGATGIGGVVGLLRSVLGLLRGIDEALLVFGALAFLVAAGALGWYLRTREHHLRIERAGDVPLLLAVGDDSPAAETLERLHRAIRPDVDRPSQA